MKGFLMASSNGNKVTLTELYRNKLLISKLDVMIDEGKTLQYMTDYANSMDVNVSLGTIRNYKQKRSQSIADDVPIESLLDKRSNTGNITELRPKESITGSDGSDSNDEGVGVYKRASEKLININQALEILIQKGMAGVEDVDFVDQNVLIKAIQEYNKVNAGNGGLTMSGLQEMRLQQVAYESAITNVMIAYIPEEKQKEALERMHEAEEEYYRNLDITEEGRRIKRELEKLEVL